MERMNPDISIIIVNYNCDAYIADCIRSVYRQVQDISFEIIVSDNNSTDDSLLHIRQQFPEVVIVENGKNLGFGAANNAGAKVAKGKYLLLLNPDTLLVNNALLLLYRSAEEKGSTMGCCGGNLLDEHRQPANLGGNFPSLFQLFSDIGFRFFYKGYYTRKVSLLLTADTLPRNRYIDCICGADLLIRKSVFEQMKGFDEDYFLYYEDTDLCYRLKEAGYLNHIVPEAQIMHLESAAIADNRAEKLNLRKFAFFEKSKQLFFKKTKGTFAVGISKMLTVLYLFTRLIAHRGSVKNYIEMMRITIKMRQNQ